MNILGVSDMALFCSSSTSAPHSEPPGLCCSHQDLFSSLWQAQSEQATSNQSGGGQKDGNHLGYPYKGGKDGVPQNGTKLAKPIEDAKGCCPFICGVELHGDDIQGVPGGDAGPAEEALPADHRRLAVPEEQEEAAHGGDQHRAADHLYPPDFVHEQCRDDVAWQHGQAAQEADQVDQKIIVLLKVDVAAFLLLHERAVDEPAVDEFVFVEIGVIKDSRDDGAVLKEGLTGSHIFKVAILK